MMRVGGQRETVRSGKSVEGDETKASETHKRPNLKFTTERTRSSTADEGLYPYCRLILAAFAGPGPAGPQM